MYLSYRGLTVRIINSGFTTFPSSGIKGPRNAEVNGMEYNLCFSFFKEDETWVRDFVLCVPICNFRAKEV